MRCGGFPRLGVRLLVRLLVRFSFVLLASRFALLRRYWLAQWNHQWKEPAATGTISEDVKGGATNRQGFNGGDPECNGGEAAVHALPIWGGMPLTPE